MPLDPQAQAVIDTVNSLGLPPVWEVTPEQARINAAARPRPAGPGGGCGGEPQHPRTRRGCSRPHLYSRGRRPLPHPGLVPRRRLGRGRPGVSRRNGAAPVQGRGLRCGVGGLPPCPGDQVPRPGRGTATPPRCGRQTMPPASTPTLPAWRWAATAPGATWQRRFR